MLLENGENSQEQEYTGKTTALLYRSTLFVDYSFYKLAEGKKKSLENYRLLYFIQSVAANIEIV